MMTLVLVLGACVHAGQPPSTPTAASDAPPASGPPDSPAPGTTWEFIQQKYRAAPVYPQHARDLGIEGDCSVKILIARTGIPVSYEIAECPKELQQAAVDAAMASTFYPRATDAKPELVAFKYVYHFNLTPLTK